MVILLSCICLRSATSPCTSFYHYHCHPSHWDQASHVPSHGILNTPVWQHSHFAADEAKAQSRQQFAWGCPGALPFVLHSHIRDQSVKEKQASDTLLYRKLVKDRFILVKESPLNIPPGDATNLTKQQLIFTECLQCARARLFIRTQT